MFHALQKRFTYCTGVARSAREHARCALLEDGAGDGVIRGGVSGACPLVVSGMMNAIVTAAAYFGRHGDERTRRGIANVGNMAAARAVAVLALHSDQVRRGCF